MKKWTTALPDWERCIVAGDSILPCGPLFEEPAREGLDYFSRLVAVDIAGSPTFGEISRPWVLDLVSVILGACDPETGRQAIKEIFLLVGKKNGKSQSLSGIILTALLLNWRASGEMGILAPTIEVANNAWRPAKDAIAADEELSDLLHVQDHIRTITHRTTGATLQVVAADSDTVAGKKWSVTLIDELWLFGKKSNANSMLLEATGGQASRPEGFTLYSSTQSDTPPAGVFKTKLEYARAVRDGKIEDPEFLPVIYEFPPSMIESKAYLDEKNWYIPNPNLGASVDPSYIRRKIREAEFGTGDDTLQAVLAKHLNVEIDMNLRADRWAGADHWAARGRKMSLDALLSRSEVVVAGIDGGGLDDLLGLAVIGRDRETGRWLHWGRAWAHVLVLERRKEIAPRLRDFERAGDLVVVQAVGEDVEQLAATLAMIYTRELFPPKNAIGMDQIGISFEEDFDEAGIPSELLIGVSQGYRLGGTIKTLERKLADGSFEHCNQPMMAWCASNCRVEQRANSILITKQASGKAKIDPIMAMLDAAQLMALNPESRDGADIMAAIRDPIIV